MVRGIQDRRKRYVHVVADHFEDGTVLPREIIWEDGRTFEIARVLDRRRAASMRVGGVGLRFVVLLEGADSPRVLYCEGDRWFVEAIIPGD